MATLSSDRSFGAVGLLLNHLKYYGVAYVALYVFITVVKRKYFSPLSRYPGPFWAGITEMWKLKATFSKRQHLIYYDLHQKYGPVFRDGPYSLSYCDRQAMKIIYGQLGKNAFPRAPSIIPKGLNPDHPPVFFSMTPDVHSKAKKKVAGAYSMTSILQMEASIDRIVKLFLSRLHEKSALGAIDFSLWTNYMTIDVISQLAYGQEFGFLESGTDVNGILAALQGSFGFLTTLNFFPFLADIIFSRAVERIAPLPTDTGFGLIIQKAKDIVEERHSGRGGDQRDLVNIIMEHRDADGNPPHRDQVRGEVNATLIAGADTTSSSIMGIVGNLIRNPAVAHKLQAEIDAAYSAGLLESPIPAYQSAAKLPYLNACISESLRLSPAIANIFYREVPSGGSTIMGHFVPEGTFVGVNNWVFGHDQNFYGEDAGVFRPERWLDEKNSRLLHDYEFSFGHGARLCIGKNIALVELYKSIVVLFRDFNIFQAKDRLWIEEAKLFLYKTDMQVLLEKRGEKSL